MPSVLMVIAPLQFRDEEYTEPKAVFESRGATVTTASVDPGQCMGRFGTMAHADISLADADPSDYDVVVFVGGAGAKGFFNDPDAHRLAIGARDLGRFVAAICIAPSILAHAGLLSGRRATAFESQEDDLVERGAIWTGQSVTVDPPFVTANGPDAARAFGEAVSDLAGF